MLSKVVDQSKLTADCWWVQMYGLKRCKCCEFQGTKECGGKAILKKIEEGTFPKDGLPDQSKW